MTDNANASSSSHVSPSSAGQDAAEQDATAEKVRPSVALFVTCLVDLFRPSVGFAAIDLLQQAGCRVAVPGAQTCCGQPAWNSGDVATTAAMAKSVIAAFEPYDYVVVPSGSCAGMIRRHYPQALRKDSRWEARAHALGERTYELTAFLVDVMDMKSVDPVDYQGRIAYHDSCSGLRELGVKAQPRQLLESVAGAELVDLPGAETCCGFGGTFCVKYPGISGDMVTEKANAITGTGADTVLAGDLGCLMNIAGKLNRDGSMVQVRHVAEVLAGAVGEAPPIGRAVGDRAGTRAGGR
ncbi:(Fe-S)-binding protein [Fodinicurvata sp. EGI_FJ10296]|uniref:(Fe-S)-binding protein n=1 Tax=Fodinicurvata sp. EGI_FJ10296 TaxID=3231908 RepID=UPI003455B928